MLLPLPQLFVPVSPPLIVVAWPCLLSLPFSSTRGQEDSRLWATPSAPHDATRQRGSTCPCELETIVTCSFRACLSLLFRTCSSCCRPKIGSHSNTFKLPQPHPAALQPRQGRKEKNLTIGRVSFSLWNFWV